MIPPLQPVRLRCIERWLEDQQPTLCRQLRRSGELAAWVGAKDQAMMDEFDELDSALMYRLMREDRWGTQIGMQEYHSLRLSGWSDIVHDKLPLMIIDEP